MSSITCYYCNGRGHTKRDCPKKKRDGPRAFVCYNCNEPGHSKRDCPNRPKDDDGVVCFNCNETGHMRRDCPKGRGEEGGRRDIICHNCNEPGHMRRDCPREKRDTGGRREMVCYNCNETGHMKRDCPNRKDTPIVCYHCNQPGHMKRECPELSAIWADQASPGPLSPEAQQQQPTTHDAVKEFGTESKDDPDSENSRPPFDSSNADQSSFTAGILAEPKIKSKGEQKGTLPPFVDTHCHLEYVFEKYRHRSSFSTFAANWNYPENFEGCIASFCDPAAFSSFGLWNDLLSEPGSKVWASFGIHPHNAKYFNSEGLEGKLLKCLGHERCVALGEIGLDYGPNSASDPKTQREVLTHQLKLAVQLRKPLVLHCRDAEEELLEILKVNVPSEWKIHLHCYTGTYSIAQAYLDHYPNLYLGVTGNVTFDTFTKVHEVVRRVPLERLLVETDAPYNTPRNLPGAEAARCKFSHPAHAYYVAKEIASLKGVELSEALRVLRENTRKMYNI